MKFHRAQLGKETQAAAPASPFSAEYLDNSTAKRFEFCFDPKQ
jgi:hypothetical protein